MNEDTGKEKETDSRESSEAGFSFNDAMDDSYNPFIVDTTNRKISVIPTVKIAVDSRAFLKLHPHFLISGVLYADPTVTSVAGTLGETTLNSYTVPLNTISRNDSRIEKSGNVFRIRASGRYTTDDATATVAIALKVGSTTYHTITTTGATIANAPWIIDWTVMVVTVGSSGTTESFVTARTNNVNKDSASTVTRAIDTTANQAISITATWASGSAGDDVSIRTFLVELVN